MAVTFLRITPGLTFYVSASQFAWSLQVLTPGPQTPPGAFHTLEQTQGSALSNPMGTAGVSPLRARVDGSAPGQAQEIQALTEHLAGSELRTARQQTSP